jgi:hypothetical protein
MTPEAAAFAPQEVRVGGRVTTVREATSADADALLAHYQGLSFDDLHRRFLATFQPRMSFVERWLGRDTDGGVVLVAVEGDPVSGRIVGDAGYAPTGPDTGELALTVASDRRGWLGPYLLALLLEHARAHGIVDLTGEVLATNAGMLALARARGAALRPTHEPTVLEVVIGTGATPAWPADTPHPRVLIEGSLGAWPGTRGGERAGVGVLACPGPGGSRVHPCPLLRGGSCELLEGADAVVVALRADDPGTRPLLAAHDARETAQPLAVAPHLRPLVEDAVLAAGTCVGDALARRAFVLDPQAGSSAAIETVRDVVARAGGAQRDDDPAST